MGLISVNYEKVKLPTRAIFFIITLQMPFLLLAIYLFKPTLINQISENPFTDIEFYIYILLCLCISITLFIINYYTCMINSRIRSVSDIKDKDDLKKEMNKKINKDDMLHILYYSYFSGVFQITLSTALIYYKAPLRGFYSEINTFDTFLILVYFFPIISLIFSHIKYFRINSSVSKKG